MGLRPAGNSSSQVVPSDVFYSQNGDKGDAQLDAIVKQWKAIDPDLILRKLRARAQAHHTHAHAQHMHTHHTRTHSMHTRASKLWTHK